MLLPLVSSCFLVLHELERPEFVGSKLRALRQLVCTNLSSRAGDVSGSNSCFLCERKNPFLWSGDFMVHAQAFRPRAVKQSGLSVSHCSCCRYHCGRRGQPPSRTRKKSATQQSIKHYANMTWWRAPSALAQRSYLALLEVVTFFTVSVYLWSASPCKMWLSDTCTETKNLPICDFTWCVFTGRLKLLLCRNETKRSQVTSGSESVVCASSTQRPRGTRRTCRECAPSYCNSNRLLLFVETYVNAEIDPLVLHDIILSRAVAKLFSLRNLVDKRESKKTRKKKNTGNHRYCCKTIVSRHGGIPFRKRGRLVCQIKPEAAGIPVTFNICHRLKRNGSK